MAYILTPSSVVSLPVFQRCYGALGLEPLGILALSRLTHHRAAQLIQASARRISSSTIFMRLLATALLLDIAHELVVRATHLLALLEILVALVVIVSLLLRKFSSPMSMSRAVRCPSLAAQRQVLNEIASNTCILIAS
eukprot:13013000-Heterocapsa_arctica.AAC.1